MLLKLTLLSPLTFTVRATPTAFVRNGTLQGVSLTGFAQEAFLGVRYAQAPVGDLRLRQSLALNSTFDGVVKATEYSPWCPGFGTTDAGQPQDEDCLALNIIRPVGVVPGSNVPTAVWIYGGGWSHGGSADIRQNQSWVVQRSVAMDKPIVGLI
ncbi:hypothetical protein RQP46_003917 [Phenoliferia psychrophenolica]